MQPDVSDSENGQCCSIPPKSEVKYLGMHLDRRLDMGKERQNQKKTAQPKNKQMHWLLGKSTQSIGSKIFLYKAILKQIWTYSFQIWGTPPIPKSKSSSAFNPIFPIHSEFNLVHKQSQDP
jgi:hypothetical protein